MIFSWNRRKPRSSRIENEPNFESHLLRRRTIAVTNPLEKVGIMKNRLTLQTNSDVESILRP